MRAIATIVNYRPQMSFKMKCLFSIKMYQENIEIRGEPPVV